MAVRPKQATENYCRSASGFVSFVTESRRDQRTNATHKRLVRAAAVRHRRLTIEPLDDRSLLAPLVNTGSAIDIIYALPAGADAIFLEDDGVNGNGLLQLRSGNGTFDATVFANPTGS